MGKRRHRQSGMCENQCSGHGTCEFNDNCKCYTGIDGEAEWTGADCSLRTCPKDYAGVGSVVNANDLHPWVECSNKGTCDRSTGECKCFTGYERLLGTRNLRLRNWNLQLLYGILWYEMPAPNYCDVESFIVQDASQDTVTRCDIICILC